MEHLSFNDIGTIKIALQSHAEHKERLAEIVSDERVRGYLQKERDEVLRLVRLFDAIGNRLLDMDLGQSLRISASFMKR